MTPAISHGRRAAAVAAIAAFLLHALALLSTWRSWDPFGRRNVLTWIDFPVSLLFLERPASEWDPLESTCRHASLSIL